MAAVSLYSLSRVGVSLPPATPPVMPSCDILSAGRQRRLQTKLNTPLSASVDAVSLHSPTLSAYAAAAAYRTYRVPATSACATLVNLLLQVPGTDQPY